MNIVEHSTQRVSEIWHTLTRYNLKFDFGGMRRNKLKVEP